MPAASPRSAPVDDIFAQPSHPYTALLLASVPKLDDAPKADLATIEGTVPTPNEFGGLPFRRALSARDRRVAPNSRRFSTGGGHFSACWHIDRMAEIREVAA
jgi:peptide/nickel transport system ATP-binding protein